MIQILLFLVAVVCGIEYFDIAGVLPLTGYLSQDMTQAEMGYRFFCDYLNQQGGFSIAHLNGETYADQDGNPYNFAFNCTIEDNEGSKEIHMQKYAELLKQDTVDFYVGSHIHYEFNSSVLVDKYNKIIFQCCVGPDVMYEDLDLLNLFGIQVSNMRYGDLIVKEFGFRGVDSMGIIRQSDNTFTMSTCTSAIEKALDRGVEVNEIVDFSLEGGDNVTQKMDEFVDKLQQDGVQAIIACLQVGDATYLTQKIDQIELGLKALFVTTAPWYQSYIDDVGEISEYVTSAGQWHWAMANEDDYFRSNQNYVQLFQSDYDNQKPTYVAAGATAVMEAYMFAIQRAFAGCDVSNAFGDPKKLLYDVSAIDCRNMANTTIGYDLVHQALSRLDVQTFFGSVGFNKYRRNVAMDPATIQIQINSQQVLENQCVLPVNAANAILQLPQPNRYKQQCPAGYKQPLDDFQPCIPCPRGMKSFCEDCLDCDYCARDEYNDEEGQASCKVCPENTRAIVAGATNITQCQCKNGYYHPQQIPGEPCRPCENGGNCLGELSQMFPLRGYWMDPADRTKVHACSPAHVCVGGQTLECATGYSGRLCGSCAEGYYQLFSDCRQCPSRLQVVGQLFGIAIAWWIINAVISRQMETFDVILNWIQLLSVVGEFDMNWPGSIYTILQLAALFAFEVDIIELSCLFNNWGFLHNFVVQLLMPAAVAFMATSSFFCTYLIYRYRDISFGGKLHRMVSFNLSGFQHVQSFLGAIGKNLGVAFGTLVIVPSTWDDVKRAFNISLAVSMSFVSISYLTLVKYSFDAFKCVEISGVSVMKNSVDVQCDSDEYQVIRILGIVGIVVYVVAFPIFAFITLMYLKNNKAFHIQGQLERYGWLYHRYEVEWYWYEMSQIGHRLIFVLILVFIDSPSMQSSLATLVTIGLLMLHIYSRPYIDVVLDILHTFLQVALMVVILSGLVFYNPEVSARDNFVMEVIILSTLGLFGFIFLGFLLRNFFEIFVHMYASFRIQRVVKRVQVELGDMDNVSELLHTFELRFLIPWVQYANEEELQSLNNLAQELAEYVSNESDTSYLSLTKTGRWWRFLSQRFPEVIDFLAVVDDETRGYFVKFVEVLYQYFFRYKGNNNIYELISWQDRAAVAQWLALASDENRQLFNSVVKTSFRHAKGKQVAQDHLMRVVTYGRMQASGKGTKINAADSTNNQSAREMQRMGSSLNRKFSLARQKSKSTPQPSSLENRVTDIRASRGLLMRTSKFRSSTMKRISRSMKCLNPEVKERPDIVRTRDFSIVDVQARDQSTDIIADSVNEFSPQQSPREEDEIQTSLENTNTNTNNNQDVVSDQELLRGISECQDIRLVGRYGSESGMAPHLEVHKGLGPWNTTTTPRTPPVKQLSKSRTTPKKHANQT